MPCRPAAQVGGGQGVRSDPESEGFEEKYRAVINGGDRPSAHCGCCPATSARKRLSCNSLSASTLVLANRSGSALLIICASRRTWPSNSRKAASFAVIASRSGSSAAYARLRRSVLAAGSASTSAVVVLTAVSAPFWRGLRALALTFSPALAAVASLRCSPSRVNTDGTVTTIIGEG